MQFQKFTLIQRPTMSVKLVVLYKRNHSEDTPATSPITLSINTDGVPCVALEVGQGGTGCCCTVHCVNHQRASLRLVVNPNTVKTHQQILTWPLPQHSDTCVVCSGFRVSSHSDRSWYICRMAWSLMMFWCTVIVGFSLHSNNHYIYSTATSWQMSHIQHSLLGIK